MIELNYGRMAMEGLAVGAVAVAFVIIYMLISEHQDRRRAAWIAAQEREEDEPKEWSYHVSWIDRDGVTHDGWPSDKLADRCEMENVGGGRVCRLCGKHTDAHMNGIYCNVGGRS